MWGSFILAVAFVLVLVYVPGYLFSRAFFNSAASSLAFAPVATLVLLVVLGIVVFPLSIPWFVLPLLTLSAGFILYVRFRKPLMREKQGTWIGLVLYAVMGLLTTTAILLANIDGATSFSVQADTTFHLQCAQAMLQSGHYSILSTSAYPDLIAQGKGSFYPAAWHIVTALASGATSTPATVAYNAVNYVICAVVFPLSTWLFLSRLFEKDKVCILSGGLVCGLFACFPWNFLIMGQYDANLLSFSLIPSFLYVMLCILNSREERSFFASVAMLMIAGVSLAVSQTNALFSAGVICIPLIVRFAWKKATCGSGSLLKGLAASLSVCAVIAIIWYIAYSLPFMQPVAQCQRDICATKPQGLINVLLLSFGSSAFAPQPILAILVLAGAFIVVLRKRLYLWVVVAYLISCFLYFICASIADPIRQLLCGFWYVGVNRIGGMAILVAVPLASIALGGIASLVRERFSISILKAGASSLVLLLLAGVMTNAALGLLGLKSGLQNVSERIEADYKYSNVVAFEQAERDFIEEIKPYVGDDLVVNIPSDGSVWLYGTDKINTQCRTFYDSPSSEYDLFKASLNQVATNEEVKQAVEDSGAKYLLYLDESIHAGSFDESEWKGMLSVTDDTPGFETVLADGSMRLYRISA